MSAPQPNALPPDSIENTIMGVHMGMPTTLLSRQHVAASVNVTHRGGKPRTRPAIVKRTLDFADDDSDENSTEALFQGAAFYEGFGNQRNVLIASIGGRLFRYDVGVSSVKVQDISVSGDLNSPVAPQVWMFQGEDFLVINDGLSNPIIFDGSSSRRSAGAPGKELPPGTVGTYANGRIVMALPDRRSFIAGDLVYSNGNFGAYGGRDAILKTTENLAVLGGAAFAVPVNAGRINAMFTVAVPDTSLGQSSLQIGTRKSIFGVNLPLDATQWGNLQQPTAVVSFPGPGPLSQHSVAVINSDAWYRGFDGIRSFQVGRRDLGTWVQTPLSSEVEPIIKHDTEHLLEFASATQFHNRLLMTCSPYRVSGRGVAHRGMIALDFNNVSALTMKASPNYDGVWTGAPILQIVEGNFNGVERCFLFALDSDLKICLYEVLKDGAAYHDYNGTEDVAIECWIASSALFGLEVHSERIRLPMKKLMTADIFLEDLAGAVAIDVKYRSDSYPCWVDWKEFSLCATDCATPDNCTQPVPLQKQYATYRRLPDPLDDCNALTGRLHRTGYHFQLRVQWTGHASLDKLLLWCVPTPETNPGCPTNEACKTIQCCGEDYFTYLIEDPNPVDPHEPEDPDEPEEPVDECPLEVTTQPEGATYQIGSMIELSVAVTGNTSPPRIVWKRDGVEIIDGYDEHGGLVEGATTGELIIWNAQVLHSGSYTATIFDDAIEACIVVTTPANVLVELSDIGIDDGDWGICLYNASFIESAYGFSASGPSPTELSDEDKAFMLTLFANEQQIWLDANLPENAAIISLPSPEWYLVGSSGTLYHAVNKILSESTDPTTGNQTVFFSAGYWILRSRICYQSE